MLWRGLCNEDGALRIQDHNLSEVGFVASRHLIICLLGVTSSRLLGILTKKICCAFCLDLFLLCLLLVFVMLRSSLGLVVILIVLDTL